jgi:hypothetical protein
MQAGFHGELSSNFDIHLLESMTSIVEGRLFTPNQCAHDCSLEASKGNRRERKKLLFHDRNRGMSIQRRLIDGVRRRSIRYGYSLTAKTIPALGGWIELGEAKLRI